ncbi:hypothetical protein AMECASPLE_033763 [Ameca splendens]|uniref:Uncharacterized protein n=1 Tax=Ameca splendens TaxID=208324 RepID=A0ABV0XK13_9TELE
MSVHWSYRPQTGGPPLLFAQKSSDHNWLCLEGPAHLSLVSFPALILFTSGKFCRLTTAVVVLLQCTVSPYE